MQAGPPVISALRGPVIIHLRTTTTHGRILGAKEARSCEIRSKRANPLISSPLPPSRHMKLWRAAYTATRARRVRVCGGAEAKRGVTFGGRDADQRLRHPRRARTDARPQRHRPSPPPSPPPELIPVDVSLCSATNHWTGGHQS